MSGTEEDFLPLNLYLTTTTMKTARSRNDKPPNKPAFKGLMCDSWSPGVTERVVFPGVTERVVLPGVMTVDQLMVELRRGVEDICVVVGVVVLGGAVLSERVLLDWTKVLWTLVDWTMVDGVVLAVETDDTCLVVFLAIERSNTFFVIKISVRRNKMCIILLTDLHN